MGKPGAITNWLFSRTTRPRVDDSLSLIQVHLHPSFPVADPGRGPGGPGPPLFRDQTKARKAGKNFFETTPPPYARVSHARGVKIARIVLLWHFEPWIIRRPWIIELLNYYPKALNYQKGRKIFNGNLEIATRCSYMYGTTARTVGHQSHVKPQTKFDAQKVN